MVSIVERRLLARHVADFVGGVLKPSEFLGRLAAFERSRDEAVKEIVDDMVMFVEMHESGDTIVFSSTAWDDFQRVLLFLRTDLPEVGFGSRRPRYLWRWNIGQIAGIIGMLIALCALDKLLLDYPVCAYLTCSCIAAVCMRWNTDRSVDWCPDRSGDGVPMEKLYPFGSAAQLIRERRLARGFAKVKFFPEETRRNRKPGFWTRERAWGKAALFHIIAFAVPPSLLLMCLPDRIMADDARRWC